VIINIPTAEDLNDIALRLHFSAWTSLIRMYSDFDLTFDPAHGEGFWKEEWAEYLVACQPELQSVCALIQQSNELALKAKICEVSPFLLLLGNAPKFSKSRSDVDFSDFRTIDAVDLPGAVNTLCSEALSDGFVQSYDEVRSLRNRITHLGQVGRVFDPKELLRILVSQYAELWKRRAWLSDWVQFAGRTRLSFFNDDKYASTHMEVMHDLPYVVDALTKSEFKLLFGYPKSTRRYLCHPCIENASTRHANLDMDACKTAFLNKAGDALHCVMCGEHFKVARAPCGQEECPGNVIGDNDDDYAGMCHTCGEHQGDEQ
jgi:hypothetical protein